MAEKKYLSSSGLTAYTNQIKSLVSTLLGMINGKADSSHAHTLSNITDISATATEVNYLDGVTSNIQGQLNNKAASSHNHDTVYHKKADLQPIANDVIDSICNNSVSSIADEVEF